MKSQIGIQNQEDNVNFDDLEKEIQKKIKDSGANIKISGKQKTSIAVANLVSNFLTKKSYQMSLFIYLVITIPVGTFCTIRFIINLFF